MAERRVAQSGKDADGDITKLCNPNETWSPRIKVDAIRDIDSGTHKYYVNETGHKASVRVYTAGGKKHLRTDADSSSANNLDNLPDC